MSELSERAILERVARGELSAEEADALLDSLDVDDVPQVVVTMSGGGLMLVEGQPGDETIIDEDPAGDGHACVPANADLTCLLNGATAMIRGVTGTLDATLNVGDADIDGRFTRGRSVVRVNCGRLSILLDRASDVRVEVQPDVACDVGDGLRQDGPRTWVVGRGAAELVVVGNLGVVELQLR